MIIKNYKEIIHYMCLHVNISAYLHVNILQQKAVLKGCNCMLMFTDLLRHHITRMMRFGIHNVNVDVGSETMRIRIPCSWNSLYAKMLLIAALLKKIIL